ncbi:MAG: alanine--glyoxylate aminotransferase family protein [Candidatus Bathyarchaeia archaeon]
MILLTPGPSMISQRVSDAMQKELLFHRSEPFRLVLSQVEELLMKLFMTDMEVCVLTGSGTLAVESMVFSLVERGDRVLIIENGEFGKRLRQSLIVRGAEVTVLSSDLGKVVSLEVIKNQFNKNKFEALFMVYTETSTGVTNRYIREVCDHASDQDTLVCIDAISAIGGEPLMFSKWKLDAVAGCSQKCVGAPPGLSFVALSERAVKKVMRTSGKPQYLDLGIYLDYLKRRETPFTPAVNILMALREALLEISEMGGPEAKWKRQRSLAEILYAGSEQLGVRCFVTDREYRSNTIAAFLPPAGFTSREVVDKLWNEGYVISQGMGRLRQSIFRVGIMGAVSEEEVKGYLEALSKVLNN